MTVPMWIRKTLRPLIPDPVMAVIRMARQSTEVRTNVDVAVQSRRQARSWLLTTPDTYRVRLLDDYGSVPSYRLAAEDTAGEADVVVVALADHEAGVEDLARLLSDRHIDAAVLGETPPPRLSGRRRREPEIAPVAIAMRSRIWDELGRPTSGAADLPAVLARLRDAGYRLGLIPTEPSGALRVRLDPIAAPTIVVFSAVPIHDVGGGSRGAQLGLELLRRGYHVVYVALHPSAESVDLGLRVMHPNLEQETLDGLDLDALIRRAASQLRAAIAELPSGRLLPGITRLGEAGFRIVYDLIDDWTHPALGGDWYRADDEAAIVALADVLVASAPDLVDMLERTGRPVTLVPNAVNAAVFGRPPGPKPADFPAGPGPVIGYHGSLYGDWFDWDGLADVAESYPSARVVVIGDDKGHPALPDNVFFLGLKAQHELVDYVTRFDVGLVPFVVSDVTHAVSPLKVYEYLASGVPVAAPPLRSLAGLDGVYLRKRLPDAVAAALTGPRPDRARALAEHSWGARVDTLLTAAGLPVTAGAGSAAETAVRPVVHYGRKDRRPR